VGFAFFNIKVRKNMEYGFGYQKQVLGLYTRQRLICASAVFRVSQKYQILYREIIKKAGQK